MKYSVLAYRAANSVEAHLVRHVLEANDIPVEIVGEGLAGAVGELPVDVLQLEIRTPPEFADQARDLIESYQNREESDEPPWQCPFCGAENDAEYEICWRCQKERQPFE